MYSKTKKPGRPPRATSNAVPSPAKESMADPILECPHCQGEFPLTEALAAPLLAAQRAQDHARRAADHANFKAQLAEQERVMTEREEAMQKEKRLVAQQRRSIEEQVNRKHAEERQAIIQSEAKKAAAAAAAKVAEQTRIASAAQKRVEAYEAEAKAHTKKETDLLRELRKAKAEVEASALKVEKGIHAGLAEARQSWQKAAEESFQIQLEEKTQLLAERNTHVATLQRTIDELKRKSEQGSQQLQGEAQELLLESTLRTRFPLDAIEPVAKGEFGGDVMQYVHNASGQPCGSILWESKRTKSWQDTWLTKLRDDQRTAKADIAVIVSQARPKDIDHFHLLDGVWVVSWHIIIPFAAAMRASLSELSVARRNIEGQQTKTELVYQYMTGPHFRHRVEAMVEAYYSLRRGLHKEKISLTKAWSVRDKQLDQLMIAMSGMWGDLQGIAGQSLHEMKGLELETSDENDDEDDGMSGQPALISV
jgi:hypothetical protein